MARALITGAAGGIGRATALRLAKDGYELLLLDRDLERLTALAAEVQAAGGRATPYAVDVTDGPATKDLVETLWAEGPIDVVMTAAGILRLGLAEAVPTDDYTRSMAVNFHGTVHVINPLLPLMRARGKGHLVLMASMAGLRGMAHFSAYAASKFAVVGYAQALRDELAGSGVQISIICPPSIGTSMVTDQPYLPPIYKRFAWREPKDVANAIAAALASPRFLVLIDGSSRLLVLLERLLPSLVDRLILTLNR
jgi:short-subunit dehydrogenase